MTTETASDIKLSETESIIASMLRENTGRHFLDSGGAYGRNWERNRNIPAEAFKASPEASLTFRWNSPEITVSVFHFLSRNLDHSPTLERVFRLFERIRDVSELEASADFLAWLREQGIEVSGIYGEGEPCTVNTYNGEDLLSQTIQYTYASLDGTLPLSSLAMLVSETLAEGFDDDAREDAREEWKALLREAREGSGAIDAEGLPLSEPYTFLQIHGGCDVRGGYTDIRVFTDSGSTELGIFDNAKATIFDSSRQNPSVKGDDSIPGYWTTDDGCHFYQEGCCGRDYRQLESFDIWKLPEGFEGEDGIDRAREEAYRLACQEGQTGAIKALEARIADAETEGDDDEARFALLLKATLTGEMLPFLPVTEQGSGFSPYTLGKLEASTY